MGQSRVVATTNICSNGDCSIEYPDHPREASKPGVAWPGAAEVGCTWQESGVGSVRDRV